MISVRNHPQQLSGNKIRLVFLVGLLCFSCGTPKTTSTGSTQGNTGLQQTGNVTYNPSNKTYRVNTQIKERMDTIQFREESSIGIITQKDLQETGPQGPVLKNSYNLALALPFQSRGLISSGASGTEQQRAIQFYAGAKIAIDELNEDGHSLSIETLDIGYKNNGNGRSKLSGQNFDLIIGPLRDRDMLSEVADICSREKTPFVSPLYPSNNIVKNNPYHIQVSPSLNVHVKTIFSQIATRHPNAKTIIVGRASKASRLDSFREEFEKMKNRGVLGDTLHEVTVNTTSTEFNKFDFVPFMDTLRENIVIVPAYSRGDASYVNSILRLISIANSEELVNITVYGMPVWKKFPNINYEYYKNLKVHMTSDFHVDERNPKVMTLKRKYYSMYNEHPSEEFYKGYDIVKYFAEALQLGGKNFNERLDQMNAEVLHTQFKFERMLSEENRLKEKFDIIERIENGHVNLIHFNNYNFELVR